CATLRAQRWGRADRAHTAPRHRQRYHREGGRCSTRAALRFLACLVTLDTGTPPAWKPHHGVPERLVKPLRDPADRPGFYRLPLIAIIFFSGRVRCFVGSGPA